MEYKIFSFHNHFTRLLAVGKYELRQRTRNVAVPLFAQIHVQKKQCQAGTIPSHR